MRRRVTILPALALACLAAGAAAADEHEGVVPVDLPVLSEGVPRGELAREPAAGAGPAAKTVDGAIGDWVGRPTRFGGSLAFDRGELIYQDHLFDAYGADDGRDAQRLAVLDPLADAVPETRRLDAAQQADIPGEFGLATPEELSVQTHYGDLEHQDAADLAELRVAADADALWLLARTTTMTAAEGTALLVLLDTAPGGARHDVPFGSGLATERAELALLLAGDGGQVADLEAGTVEELPAGSVATDPGGYGNAIEARLPRSLLGGVAGVGVAAVSGAHDGGGITPANAAFRTDEPPREHWDKRQALALAAGSVDEFFAQAPLDELAAGRSERVTPGPGYHDRVFVSDEAISQERGSQGIHQHYGLYIPEAHRPGTPSPLQLWLHFRGGLGHTAANLVPRVFRHYGEDVDTIVVTPEGRGSSRWYVGKGHVDVLEVWEDVMDTLDVDRDRVYVSGHSMGGWGSYLLGVLYPDRFAAAMPVAGPVTQGAWFGCDSDPCYQGANGGDARVQHTRRLLDNVRHVPLAIFQGAIDELVPVAGVSAQALRLTELGYPHRYYLFPAYEHYSHPIVDEWIEGVRYMHQFSRDPNPARVTYARDMPFERATESVQSDDVPLDFDFDTAYWMSELEPADAENGVARFDGRSLARSEQPSLALPEAGGPLSPGQIGPYVMTGLRRAPDPLAETPAAGNGFEATLSGATAVRLDLERMGIQAAAPVEGAVTTDRALELRLDGPFSTLPPVTVDGEPVTATVDGGVLRVPLPAGGSTLRIG
ncbi:MAG: prolyl oligopeptidase family serine peptidase [Thermoleophilaceae bacterium]